MSLVLNSKDYTLFPKNSYSWGGFIQFSTDKNVKIIFLH